MKHVKHRRNTVMRVPAGARMGSCAKARALAHAQAHYQGRAHAPMRPRNNTHFLADTSAHCRRH
eukprot:7309006-Alexandrium_andersonii.AAC.1